MTLNKFIGDYFFLSNFYPCPVEYMSLRFRNSEAAFQAMKNTDYEAQKIFTLLTAKEAKELGRQIQLRPDWTFVRNDIMYQICFCKFSQNDILRKKLIATGDTYLEEGNTWGDRYWGTVDGVGENKLGQILMRVREELA